MNAAWERRRAWQRGRITLRQVSPDPETKRVWVRAWRLGQKRKRLTKRAATDGRRAQ